MKRHILCLALICLTLLLAGCSTEKNTSASRWWHSFHARYNTYYNGSLAYIDGSLEKENGNVDNYTELIPLYTVGNKNSRELGKPNFDRAIEKAQKAIKLHSIKRRPVWDKRRRKIERDIEWLGRREYNPFLWKAWMLMGRSQFHQGDFEGAISTFNYMGRLYETQPAIYGRARAWLAKSYVEADYLYDAEDVIRNMERDSIHWQARKEWDYTYADYYIHTGDYAKAATYLRRVIRHEMRRKQKAREYYLLGQLEAAMGHEQEAYKAYQKVIRQNPPYVLEFHARIAQTEVMAARQSKKMIAKLRRMAASDKNKDMLDQVYYAIGNIYLAQRDTLQAISNYELGNRKATQDGIEKGVLLLRLGDLYWARERYTDAQRCYGEAIGLLDKERKDYRQLAERSKVLDELVPYTEAVQLQDSLQALALMDERSRNEAIDRVIEALRKKEKEERNQTDEEQARQQMAANGATGSTAMPTPRPIPMAGQQNGAWYFYNPMAVQQGKQQFQRLWGKRENTDNWQRNNTTVVEGIGGAAAITDLTEAQRDSLLTAQAAEDSARQVADSAHNDPHRREYYMAQIPFTEAQLQASNAAIMEGLFGSGVIFKDKLDNLPLSEKALMRLATQYPSFDKMDEVYYHLFLLYSRGHQPSVAEGYVQRLRDGYPTSKWTRLLTDPYFVQNARDGVHIEDSIYAATYEAFRAGRNGEVAANTRLSAQRFPLGANRDKFLFIGALSKLNDGDANACIADMRTLVEQYPDSKLAEMAGMIINGARQGRRLHGGTFDLGNVWERRSMVLNDNDTTPTRKLSNERNTDFVLMLVYQPDSVDQNKLLYEVARYNFTSYLARDFNIEIAEGDGLNRMQLSGFRNYDEALQYAHQLLRQPAVVQRMGKARPIIISTDNLPLLGTQYSYDEYAAFYAKHFAPLRISTFHLLTEPVDVAQPAEAAQQEQEQISESDIDTFLEGTVIGPEQEESTPSGTTVIPSTQEPGQPAQTAVISVEAEPTVGAGTTTIPMDAEPTPSEGTTIMPTEAEPTPGGNTTTVPMPDASTLQPQTTVIPAEPVTVPVTTEPKTEKVETPTPSVPAPTTVSPARTADTPAPMTDRPTLTNGAEIIFDEPAAVTTSPAQTVLPGSQNRPRQGATPPAQGANPPRHVTTPPRQEDKKPEPRQQSFDLEDEYYDLDGF